MPPFRCPPARAALVEHVCPPPTGPVSVSWFTRSAPVGLGNLRVHWAPAADGGTDVTAHHKVLLATWPNSPSSWPRIIHPTLYEVTQLCGALTAAAAALRLANLLAQD